MTAGYRFVDQGPDRNASRRAELGCGVWGMWTWGLTGMRLEGLNWVVGYGIWPTKISWINGLLVREGCEILGLNNWHMEH